MVVIGILSAQLWCFLAALDDGALVVGIISCGQDERVLPHQAIDDMFFTVISSSSSFSDLFEELTRL